MRNSYKLHLRLVCLNCMLLIAGCSDNNHSEKKVVQQQPAPVRHQDRFGRYDSIGNLGGKPVSIPSGVVFTWVRYIGDPGDFDSSIKAQLYNRPPVTYQLPIESFGFQYRLTDGAVKTSSEQTDADYMHDNNTLIPKMKPFPWGHVIVYNIVDLNKPRNYNLALEESLQATKKVYHFNYIEQSEPVYGLIYLKANNGIDPSTNKPWQEDTSGPDIFISKNKNGEIKTYIKCDFIGKVQYCYHLFYIDNNMHVTIYISYNRVYLKLWQQTEKNITAILNSWIVTNDGKLIKKQAGKI